MNQHPINSLSKTSFLYLFIFVACVSGLGEERRLPEWYLNVYYSQIDGYLSNKTPHYIGMNPLLPSLHFQQNSGKYLQFLIEDSGRLANEFNQQTLKNANKQDSQDSQESDETLKMIEADQQIVNNEIKRIQHVDMNAWVPRRYNNIDSYAWNSLYLNYNIGFWEKTKEENWAVEGESNLLIYPASRINIVDWTEAWKEFHFDRTPQSPFYQFLAMSAPLSKKTMMSNDRLIPREVELNLFVENEMDKSQKLNDDDLNLIFFFKALIEEDVETIVAICSDPELVTAQDTKYWFLQSQEQNNVLSKCHYYWKMKFTINFGKEVITIIPSVDTADSTDLYTVYNLSIHSVEENGEEPEIVYDKVVSVYVLGSWPDHARLPQHLYNDMLGLYDIVFHLIHPDYEQGSSLLEEIDEDSVPPKIVIHCSAGVGRTGTMVLGFQMYEQMRFIDSENNQDGKLVFAQLIQDYRPTQYYQKFLKLFDQFDWKRVKRPPANNSNQSVKELNLAEMSSMMKSSKLMAYLFDSMLNYRLYRNLFVQTIDQFHWLVYFSTMLNFESIRNNYVKSENLNKGSDIHLEQLDEILSSSKLGKSNSTLQKQNSVEILSKSDEIDIKKITRQPSEILKSKTNLIDQSQLETKLTNLGSFDVENTPQIKKNLDTLGSIEIKQLKLNKKKTVEILNDKNPKEKKYSFNGIVCTEAVYQKLQEKFNNNNSKQIFRILI